MGRGGKGGGRDLAEEEREGLKEKEGVEEAVTEKGKGVREEGVEERE